MNNLTWMRTWYKLAIEWTAGYEFFECVKGKWRTVAQYKLSFFVPAKQSGENK